MRFEYNESSHQSSKNKNVIPYNVPLCVGPLIFSFHFSVHTDLFPLYEWNNAAPVVFVCKTGKKTCVGNECGESIKITFEKTIHKVGIYTLL